MLRTDLVKPLWSLCRQRRLRSRECGVQSVALTGDEVCANSEDCRIVENVFGGHSKVLPRIDMALALGIGCKEGLGFHLREDMWFAEVVDEDSGENLENDNVGLLTVSNLFSSALPVLRYVTSLRVQLRRSNCNCGTGQKVVVPAEER